MPRKFMFPAVAVALVIVGLLIASFYTGRTIDAHQNTTSGPTTAETGQMGSGTEEAGQGQTKGDDQKPPAPAARP